MLIRTSVGIFSFVVLTATPAVVTAQTPPPPPTQTTAQQPPATAKTALPALSDADFVKQAAQAEEGEIDLAELARKNSSNDRIKEFAAKLDKEHRAAQAQLRMLADREDIDLPDTTTEQNSTEVRLKGLTGAAFDRAWLEEIIKSHERAVELYTQGTSCGNMTLRTYAETKLPAIKEHLKEAKALRGNE